MIRDVVVVIPMYRENLTSSENVALSQVKHVLYDYPIYLIMPKKMEKNNLFPELYKEFFSDEYFVSAKSYSKLMMETDFYKRFNNYKYILIYQLDAFVFSDRLKEFCALDYDYIGAPTPRSQWKYCGRIGNGGLSLRKVEKCINVTNDKERIFRMSGMEDAFLECEDKFFGYCGVSKNIDLSHMHNLSAYLVFGQIYLALCRFLSVPLGFIGSPRGQIGTPSSPMVSARTIFLVFRRPLRIEPARKMRLKISPMMKSLILRMPPAPCPSKYLMMVVA